MIQQIDAVYEDGLLRPSHPLQLAQDDELFNPDFAMDENPDTAPSLEEIRSGLSSIQGSMDSAIDELRGEF